jgi:prepilin-type processing-associated H-X9-DG protein/prepilin-type N-terminal cleavage/methylation domain-containing protein
MRPRHAFTLVELLVVVGIVSVLVALLMPALAEAREAANRAKCLATLRGMAQAAHMHATEHGGYMPAAGYQGPRALGVLATSAGLLDSSRRKYSYWYDHGNEVWRPLPLPAALGPYMGLKGAAGVATDAQGYNGPLSTQAFYRPFACPSQPYEEIRHSQTLRDEGGTYGSVVWMGYVFNGGVLARLVAPWGETPAGNVARVRRPTQVFLFADGVSNSAWGFTLFPPVSADETLAYHGVGSSPHFDYHRHRGRLNVVFVDGHAETLLMPDPRHGTNDPRNAGDLRRVGVTSGVFD